MTSDSEQAWLSKFVDESFSGWRAVNLNDLTRLVVDGDSVCAHLYHQQLQLRPGSWLQGGEYLSFHSAVKEFFSELLFTGVKLSVIMSGYSAPDEEFQRLETVYSRNTRSNKALMLAHARLGWQDMQKVNCMPVMVTGVFMDVLRRIDVELHMSDGVGSREVAVFANHYKCPVLAANPDFFMFDLESGYMPVERLSTVIANGLLYKISDFQSQFGLKDSKLCLILPALHGNAFIKALKADESLEHVLKEASEHDTYEDYLTDKDESMRKNFESVIKFYCDLQLPGDGNRMLLGLHTDFPEWIICKFKEGHLESQLLSVHIQNSYVLGTVVEDIRKDSAWLTSRCIRQFIYGFMGVAGETSVKEVIRAKSSPEVTDTLVRPNNLDHPVHFKEFSDKGKRALADMVLSVLNCHKISQHDIQQHFNILEDQWKLPVAATFYWYHACDNPPAQRHLVKSLLLSFLVCSGELVTSITTPLEPVTRDTKPDHMISLHVFAQWQCVYHDAMTLNRLVREPFFTTSPAYLFSGRIAMYYASFARKNQSLDSIITHDSKGWELYNRFLYLITGYDVEGRRGGHTKHQPKPKAPPLFKEQAPSLPETNRYALLSNTDC